MEKEKKDSLKIRKKIILIAIISICIVVATTVILIINNNNDNVHATNNQNNQIEELTITSNNDLGMRFTFNVEQFEKTYLKILEDNFIDYKKMVDNEQIDKNFYKSAGTTYYQFNQTANNEENQVVEYFSVYLEPESKNNTYVQSIKIIAITGMYENTAKIAKDNIFYAFMSIDNSISFEKAKNIYYEMNMSDNNYVSTENITFAFDVESNQYYTIINIYPFNEEQYKAYVDKQRDKNIYGYLYNMVNSLDIEFNPNEEQMNEMIEFYNNSKDTFNSDTLLEFILQKEWLSVREGGNIDNDVHANNYNSNSNITNNNNSSNNKNTSSSSNNNAVEDEEVEVTLNINLKSLIEKNKTAQEIKEKDSTIFIRVYIEDAVAIQR